MEARVTAALGQGRLALEMQKPNSSQGRGAGWFLQRGVAIATATAIG